MYHGVVDQLDAEKLTWASLLARWVEFARSAVAFSEDDPLRASVGDIIMLQAVWFALGQMSELDDGQRMLGLDRAAVLIEKLEQAVRNRWPNEALPDLVSELIDDARAAWHSADAALTSEKSDIGDV